MIWCVECNYKDLDVSRTLKMLESVLEQLERFEMIQNARDIWRTFLTNYNTEKQMKAMRRFLNFLGNMDTFGERFRIYRNKTPVFWNNATIAFVQY